MRFRADEDDLDFAFHGSMGVATGAVIAEFVAIDAAAAVALVGFVSVLLVRHFGEGVEERGSVE